MKVESSASSPTSFSNGAGVSQSNAGQVMNKLRLSIQQSSVKSAVSAGVANAQVKESA